MHEKAYLAHRQANSIQRIMDKGEVPYEPVVRSLSLDATKFGVDPADVESVPKIDVEEITFPIYDASGLYVLTAVKCDFDKYLQTPEDNINESDNRPWTTILMMGGGSSGAIDNMHLLFKCIHGIRHLEQQNKKANKESPRFPNRIRVVVLPHMGSSVREVSGNDPVKENNFAGPAKILKRALTEIKELGVTENVGMFGASAGGAQLTELAALLGDRVKFLSLADPAGMAEHPTLMLDFTIGQFIETFKKQLKTEFNPIQKINRAMRDMYNGISTRKGNLRTIFDLLKDFTNPVRRVFNESVAEAWGANTKGEKLPAHILGHDTTQMAREKIEVPVIFSPMLYANVVNSLLIRLNETAPTKLKVADLAALADESQENSHALKIAVLQILHQMFPRVSPDDLKVLPYETNTHWSYVDQAFWDKLMPEVAHTIEQIK